MKTLSNTIKHISAFLAVLAVLATGLIITQSTDAWAKDNTIGCGADGEKPCPVTWKATYIAKAMTKCPKGTFFDISTAACWSCPKGAFRSAAPIKSNKACQMKPRTDYAEAEKDGKVKFSKKTLKRIKKGRFDKICKGNSYYDKKGGKYGACWECPKGFVRNVLKSAKGNKACVKVTGLSFHKAQRDSKFVPCAKGFFDPRAGGQCWACPGGYFRGVTKVNSKDACFIKPTAVCDPSNILVYGKCLKKGACGKAGQRPCLIIERIPSCNGGLLEDFTSNRCVNSQILMCSTLSRVIKLAAKGAGKMSKTQEKIEKKAGQVLNTAVKTILTPPVYNGMMKILKQSTKGVTQLQKSVAKQGDFITKEFESIASSLDPIMDVADAFSKGGEKMKKLILSKKFCYMNNKEKMANLQKTLGLPSGGIKYQKASLEAPSLFDGLFIKSAHAASQYGFMKLGFGVSASYTDMPPQMEEMLKKVFPKKMQDIGMGVEIYLGFVTDLNTNFKGMFSVGPVVTSNKGFDITPTLTIFAADHTRDIGGHGFSIGVSAEGFSQIGTLAYRNVSKKNPLKPGQEMKIKSYGQHGGSVALLFDTAFKKFEGISFGYVARAGTKNASAVDAALVEFAAKGIKGKIPVIDIGWGYDVIMN